MEKFSDSWLTGQFDPYECCVPSAIIGLVIEARCLILGGVSRTLKENLPLAELWTREFWRALDERRKAICKRNGLDTDAGLFGQWQTSPSQKSLAMSTKDVSTMYRKYRLEDPDLIEWSSHVRTENVWAVITLGELANKNFDGCVDAGIEMVREQSAARALGFAHEAYRPYTQSFITHQENRALGRAVSAASRKEVKAHSDAQCKQAAKILWRKDPTLSVRDVAFLVRQQCGDPREVSTIAQCLKGIKSKMKRREKA